MADTVRVPGARLVRGALCALGLLTRIPVPSVVPAGGELRMALVLFPLVGALVGLVGGATAIAWQSVTTSTPLVAGVLGVAAMALVTGALHLDGLADLVDGLSGGRGDAGRILAIMRDSRIGAHGAVALALVLLVQSAAWGALGERGDVVSLVLGPAAARAVLVLVVVALPYARPDGLGAPLCHAARPGCAVAALTATAGICVVGARSLAFGAAVLAGGVVALLAWRRIGGATGDVYGAVVEVAQSAFALVAVAEAP